MKLEREALLSGSDLELNKNRDENKVALFKKNRHLYFQLKKGGIMIYFETTESAAA